MSTHSFDDYRTIRLKNRIAGWWFTENRTFWKIVIETIGRSMAFSLRVLLRKRIGIETFNFSMVVTGFIGIRICYSISAYQASQAEFSQYLFRPISFVSFETAFLGFFGLFYLFACGWYVIATEFNLGKGFHNVLVRGKSNLLEFIIDEEKSFVQSESFVQAAIAPVLGFTLGFVMLKMDVLIGTSCYLLFASLILFIDEFLYHRAKIRLRRIMGANEELAKQMLEEYHQKKKKRNDANKI